jgi:hypothetical protein
MPAPILHLGATVTCMHAGQATPLAPFPRVTVGGKPVTTLATPYAIAGCALTGSAPPCVTAQWTVGAVRVLAGGAPVLIQTGQAVCVSSGTGLLPLVVQPRVLAT